MERYTETLGGSHGIMWNLPCEQGATFECTRNVVEDIISSLPFVFRKYKKMRGVEMTFEIDEAYRDLETGEIWYRVNYKTKEEHQNGQTI